MKNKYILPEILVYNIKKDNIICVSNNSNENSKPTHNPWTNKEKNIVIVGSKGSGKTTIWNGLGCGCTSETTSKEKIKKHRIRKGTKWINIAETIDYGGDDINVQFYNDLIAKNYTTIYYVIGLLIKYDDGRTKNFLEDRDQIRARIVKISSVIQQNKCDNCHLRFIATWYDTYKDITHKSEKEAICDIRNTLDLKTIKSSNLIIDSDIIIIDPRFSDGIRKIKNDIFE